MFPQREVIRTGVLALHGDVTLVLATDGDQVFHWWRGTALSHSSPVNRGTRK